MSELDKPHHVHDKGYKQLLANKKTFLELLKTFVREKWTENIDESDLRRVDKSFVLRDFTEKEADIVYRLRSKDQDVIFYVLLELQSTVDFLMPLRLLIYMVEIWRDIYNNTPENERERKEFRLPAIVPAVLYNGSNKWTAAMNFKESLAGYRQFGHHVLDFRYILFDVNRYQEEELYRAANLIASVFALDQRIDSTELIKRLRNMADGLMKLSRDDFRQFVMWILHIIRAKFPKPLREEVVQMMEKANPWEVETMILNLELALDEMQEQAIFKGKLEGLKEGKLEGLKEGKLEGLKEGKLEGLKEGKLAVARNLLLLKVDVNTIIKATGLTVDEIESLKEDLQ